MAKEKVRSLYIGYIWGNNFVMDSLIRTLRDLYGQLCSAQNIKSFEYNPLMDSNVFIATLSHQKACQGCCT